MQGHILELLKAFQPSLLVDDGVCTLEPSGGCGLTGGSEGALSPSPWCPGCCPTAEGWSLGAQGSKCFGGA